MKKTGLIGLGTITKNYINGLKHAKLLSLAAVCDVSPTAVSRPYYKDYPFYTDYREMIEKEGLDYVIISTTPALHFGMAAWALTHGTNVIVEKPATVNMEEYKALLALAEANGHSFEVMYHWQTGSEVLEFDRLYDTDKITEISVSISDHYSQNGVEIDANKVGLQGVWLDSGVNVLSMIKLWRPFAAVEVIDVKVQKCRKTKLPMYLNLQLLVDGVKTRIEIDWRGALDCKVTHLILAGREIVIDHSAQAIRDGDRVVYADAMERLPAHYYHYFTRYNAKPDVPSSLAIHKVLFEVNERL